jgi:hypothetical protein
MTLEDALALTLLLANQPDLFGRLSARWVTRFASEVRDMRLHHVQLALAALAAVRPGEAAGAQALGDLCSALGRDDLVAVVDDWLERAGRLVGHTRGGGSATYPSSCSRPRCRTARRASRTP